VDGKVPDVMLSITNNVVVLADLKTMIMNFILNQATTYKSNRAFRFLIHLTQKNSDFLRSALLLRPFNFCFFSSQSKESG
jgi:hypothetical protein